MFRGLDWLVTEAAARGLRLLLVLTNYWKDYGGMRQYVAWACAQRGEEVRCTTVAQHTSPAAWWISACCQLNQCRCPAAAAASQRRRRRCRAILY